IQMHRAATADRHTAPILCAGESEVFSQNPEERLVRINFDRCVLAIQDESKAFHFRSWLFWASATIAEPLLNARHKLIVTKWRRSSTFSRIPSPQHKRIIRHVMNQL